MSQRVFITTRSGRQVNPLDFKPEDVVPVDLAHALALCNRFAGHSSHPISVAQHSVWVSRVCPRAYALQGLLHDASEAYLGDVTKWLKASPAMAGYRAAEDAVQRAVFLAYGVDPEQHESVTAADKLLVRWEHEQGFGRPIEVPGYGPTTPEEQALFKDWRFISWQEAEEQWLLRLAELRTAAWDGLA